MATKRKTEVIALRKWVITGKDFDYIVMCTRCQETKNITKFQDLFFCGNCGLDLRVCPSKANRFTIWNQQLIPVFPWSDPVKTIKKKRVRNSETVKKRKSFNE